MTVYGVGHSRSRELYDLTMLEVRRILYDDLPQRPQIVPGRLHGTRFAWMARYASLLDADEFTKFVTLMRNLNPFVLLAAAKRRNRGEYLRQAGINWSPHLAQGVKVTPEIDHRPVESQPTSRSLPCDLSQKS
jgi:hypothetical protein